MPQDHEELVGYMSYLDENDVLKEAKVTSYILQEFIEGIAVSSEGWSLGSKFAPTFNHTIENKKFSTGNLGPSTGCQGNIVWTESKSCPVIAKGIAKLNPQGHIGPIDLNTIVNEEGIWGLEWTPRFGYDATPTMFHLLDGEIGGVIADFAQSSARDIGLVEGVAGGIRLSIPPYPLEPQTNEHVENTSGIPIMGLNKSDLDHIHFYEVKINKNGNFVHSDGMGLIMVASDVADDIRGSLAKPMTIMEKVRIPDKDYRIDLEDVLEKDYDKFMSLGG
jgi:phosphoribosylamine--glycine ligase